MSEDQLKKYFEMMIAMSYDCMQGGITLAAYVNNLKVVVEILEKEVAHD